MRGGTPVEQTAVKLAALERSLFEVKMRRAGLQLLRSTLIDIKDKVEHIFDFFCLD